ncbi:nuclear pore membrane glycoprotein 210 isoform X2 [Rhipicephalus microplus]|uniref:nuclear pore membrane glycoprotein 210 isoform X2 n=1 Tax=Rhipicephalus microplus TaxID=6941 RepID=UPI003F6C67FE
MSLHSLFLVMVCAAEAARLDVSRVLLPHRHDVVTNYTLGVVDEDESGCYEWMSSRPEVATVFTEGPCSRQANVSAVWDQASRQETTVVAREQRTAEKLECAVVVDRLASFKLVGAALVLLEGFSQLFQVTAQDPQGDTFSSLDGIFFDWSFQQDKPVLRFMLKRPIDLHGRAVLVQGQAVGTAWLTVRPAHAAYADVPPQRLQLRVVDRVQMEPSVVFLLTGCQACFHLQPECDVNLEPAQPHVLRSQDEQVARVEGMCTWAQGLGHTQLLLADSPVAANPADVHVVRPSYLRLSVTPGESWVLERHATFQVLVQIFDEHHHQVHAGKDVRLHVHFPTEYFNVLSSTENGTIHHVRPVQTGKTVIRARLQGCRRPDGALLRATASGEQELSIEEPLLVQPGAVLLPWDPDVQPVHRVRAHIQGGTGAPVDWKLKAPPVWVRLDAVGPTATTLVTSGGPGQVQLIAHDGHLSPAHMHVSIVPVMELEALGSPVLEAELPGGELLVAVAMYGHHPEDQELKPFDDCRQVSLAVEVVDESIIKYLPGEAGPPIGRGCTSLRLQCQAAGHTRLQLSHGPLRSTVLLGCYKPLRAVHPIKAAAVAYGTIKEVAFEGGPRPWPMLPAGYKVQLSSSTANLVRVMRIVDPHRRNRDLHVFQVLCQAFGETVLALSVGNNVSASLPSPASSEAAIRFVCAVPSSLELRLHSSSPFNYQVVSKGGPVELELVVREAGGRRLANISSLDVLWDLSDYRLAKLDSHRDVTTHVDGSAGYRRTSKDFQVLRPRGKQGTLTITAKVRGLSAHVLRQAALPMKQVPTVSGSLQLQLVEGLSARNSAQHQEL